MFVPVVALSLPRRATALSSFLHTLSCLCSCRSKSCLPTALPADPSACPIAPFRRMLHLGSPCCLRVKAPCAPAIYQPKWFLSACDGASWANVPCRYKKTAQVFKHNVILHPLGGDFRWASPNEVEHQFDNFTKILQYVRPTLCAALHRIAPIAPHPSHRTHRITPIASHLTALFSQHHPHPPTSNSHLILNINYNNCNYNYNYNYNNYNRNNYNRNNFLFSGFLPGSILPTPSLPLHSDHILVVLPRQILWGSPRAQRGREVWHAD